MRSTTTSSGPDVPARSASKAEAAPRSRNADSRGARRRSGPRGADAATRHYFTVHMTADVHHARVWRNALTAELAAHPEETEAALTAGEAAARALWTPRHAKICV